MLGQFRFCFRLFAGCRTRISMRRALFLGAGFSSDFGQPLVTELTNEFRTFLTPSKLITLNQGWKKQGGGYSQKTIDKVIEILQHDKLNYENIIGALEVYGMRHQNRIIQQELHGLRQWVLELIYLLLYYRHVNNAAYLKTSIQLHRGFKSLIQDSEPLWVFTLNHDLIIELIAAEFSIPLMNGFDKNDVVELTVGHNQKMGPELRFARLRMDQQLSDNYPYKYFQLGSKPATGINLLKLHGSLDIFGYNDLNSYLSLMPSGTGIDGYLDALRILIDGNHVGPPKVTNEVLAYDKNGELQFLRRSLLSGVYKFSGRISQIVSDKLLLLFRGSLNYADELIVIGYSFEDIHINNIIRDWLSFTDKRSIKIIDPGIDDIPNFIAHLPSQIKVIKKTTVEYLSDLPCGALTAEEKRLYELRKKIRGLSKMDAKNLLSIIAMGVVKRLTI